LSSPARQRFDYAVLRTLLALSRLLPRGALLAVGRGLGTLVWRRGLYRREVVCENLRHALGGTHDESARDAVGEAFFRHLATNLMEFLLLRRASPERVREWVEIAGLEHYRDALADGRGALLVTGHFGNWELLGPRLAGEGLDVTFLAKPQSNARAERLLSQTRAQAGMRVIPTGGAFRELQARLARGETIGMVVDQDAGPSGCFVPLLGRPASFHRGMARLSLQTGAPVVSGFIFRLPDGRHRLEMGPPIRPEPGLGEAAAVGRLTETFAQRLEAAVRRAPELYVWTHRRWKTRPPEEKP
jgi:Kdo2-lipid IVA lauroyltransferase/acyltransferase